MAPSVRPDTLDDLPFSDPFIGRRRTARARVYAAFGAFVARAIGLSMLTRLPSVSVNDT